MGRYYDTSTGREGKFMFGVQPSDDAEYFGLGPCCIQYSGGGEELVDEVTKKLDCLYDLFGVEKENRVYYVGNSEEADKKYQNFEKEHLYPKCFESVKKDDNEEIDKRGNAVRWASHKGNDYIDFEIDGRAIALARIRLGLTILSDLKDEGYCNLNAEL